MPTQALSLCQEILICVSQVLRNNFTHVLLLWDCSQIILTQYWLAMFFLRIYIYAFARQSPSFCCTDVYGTLGERGALSPTL